MRLNHIGGDFPNSARQGPRGSRVVRPRLHLFYKGRAGAHRIDARVEADLDVFPVQRHGDRRSRARARGEDSDGGGGSVIA